MMPPKDVLLQTRVTPEQHQLIETAAAEQGLTVAAFIRTTAMQFSKSPLIRAWVTPYGASPEEWLARDLRPHYVLRRVGSGPNGEQTLLMYQFTAHDQLVPVPTSAIAYGMEFLKQPERHQFVLDGSHSRWFVVRTTHNAGMGLVELVLRPEGTPADRIRRRIFDSRDGELVYDLAGGGQLRGRVDVLSIGAESCELRVTGGGQRTLPYANVVAVGT
jgi:hypothetical protein